MDAMIAVSEDGLEGNVTVTKDRFKCAMIPSLQNIAFVSIVSTIYKQTDILEIIQQNCDEVKALKETEELLRKKCLLLPLPNSLKNMSLDFCKLIASQGNHMLRLGTLDDYERNFVTCRCGFNFDVPVAYFDCLCFKMNGTIDKLKTYSLMHEKGYPYTFTAACHLCSYELVSKSWGQCLSVFHNCTCRLDVYGCLREQYRYDCPFKKYWIYFLANDIFPDYRQIVDEEFECNIYEDVFLFSLGVGYFNFSAVEYFFPMVATDEDAWYGIHDLIEEAFDAIAACSNYDLCNLEVECLNIVFFLLSKLTDEGKQIQLLGLRINDLILPFVSNVLYQKFLEPVMQLVWDLLDPNDSHVSMIVLEETAKGNRIAFKLSMEMWSDSSKSLRNSIIDRLITSLEYDFDNFKQFDLQFFEILKLILSECPISEKRKCMTLLVENSSMLEALKDMNNLNVIDAFIRDTFLSESEFILFQQFSFDEYITYLFHHWFKEDDYDSIDEFLGWRFSSQSEIDDYKRSLKFRREVINSIGIYINEYDKLDKLMNWWSNSETEIIEFKNFLAYNADFFFAEFGLFLKFVDWCFVGRKKDVKRFKKFKSKFEELKNDIRRIELNDFEYVNKLLNWYLSPKKIQRFKIKHFTSRYLTDILKNIVLKKLSADRNNSEFPLICEMGENLSLWYGKVGLKRIRKLKNRMRKTKKEWEVCHTKEFSSIFKSLVDNFILSLELNHKFTSFA